MTRLWVLKSHNCFNQQCCHIHCCRDAVPHMVYMLKDQETKVQKKYYSESIIEEGIASCIELIECCISILSGATPYTRTLKTVRFNQGRLEPTSYTGDSTSSAAAEAEQHHNFRPYNATPQSGPSSSKNINTHLEH